jgi:hypothetical protein
MRVKPKFGMHNGSRANQRHLSEKDIEKLWKLIQTPLTQKPADVRDPRVSHVLTCPEPGENIEMAGGIAVRAPMRIRMHRPKFPDVEDSPTAADTRFSIKDGTPGRNCNCGRYQYSGHQKESYTER